MNPDSASLSSLSVAQTVGYGCAAASRRAAISPVKSSLLEQLFGTIRFQNRFIRMGFY